MTAIQERAFSPVRKLRLAIAAVSLTLALGSFGLPTRALAASGEQGSSDVGAQMAALRVETDQQKAQLDSQQNQIEQLRMQLEAQTAILRRAGLIETSGRGANSGRIQLISDTPPESAGGSASHSSGSGGATDERPKSERAADQLLVDAGGVLLPRWTLQVEPSTDVTHVSNPRVNIFGYTVFDAINIGTLRVDDISQDVVNNNLAVRLGLPERMQLDVRVPFTSVFVRQTKGIGTGNINEVHTGGEHIGDVQATLSWQPIAEKDWIPAVVLRARAIIPTGESVFQIPLTYPPVANGAETQLLRAPTGSGFYSVEPGFTLVWRSDPLVFFVGGSYSYHFATPHYVVPLFNPNATGTIPKVTSVDHGILRVGDVIGFNAGVNFAINERASMNFSFIDQYSMYTQQRSVTGKYRTVLGTTVNDARLGIGASLGLTDRIALVFNAGMGLTDQSPGYTFAVSVPITLPLRW